MRRLFWVMAVVALLDTMMFAAVAPLLPHYAQELGLSSSGAGLLTAAYPAGMFAGSLPAGWLATRWGVKQTLLVGMVLHALASLGFAFAHQIVLLDGARFIQGVAGAFMWAGGMGWLLSATPSERRGQIIGGALSAAIVGVLLGPVIGGAASVLSPEAVFSGVAVAAAVLGVWAAMLPGVPREEGAGMVATLRALGHPTVLLGFWLFTLPALFSGVVEVLVPLRMHELGASGVAIGAAFLVSAGVEAAISPVAGRASDRAGRLVPIRVGLVAAAVVAVLLPLPDTAFLVGAGVVLGFAALATFWAPAMALLSDASDRIGLEQAIAISISNLGWSAGHVIGAAGGGTLAHATSNTVPYIALALICGGTLVVLNAGARSALAPAR